MERSRPPEGRGGRGARFRADGILKRARYIASPNFDARPQDAQVSLVVIHNISLPPGEYGGQGVVDLFLNRLDCDSHPYYAGLRELRVSAHFFIRRDGALLQFVPCDQRAWHAGQSRWRGRERCNDFSIGIELEGSDHESFSDAQYQQTMDLIADLRIRYPIEDLAGHSEIAPGRKTDPGPYFDWQRIGRVL